MMSQLFNPTSCHLFQDNVEVHHYHICRVARRIRLKNGQFNKSEVQYPVHWNRNTFSIEESAVMRLDVSMEMPNRLFKVPVEHVTKKSSECWMNNSKNLGALQWPKKKMVDVCQSRTPNHLIKRQFS